MNDSTSPLNSVLSSAKPSAMPATVASRAGASTHQSATSPLQQDIKDVDAPTSSELAGISSETTTSAFMRHYKQCRKNRKKGDEEDGEDDLWVFCEAKLKGRNEYLVAQWREGIEAYLTYNGLFSAIVTSFIIEFYRPLRGGAVGPIPGTQNDARAPASSIATNVLFFTSLILSIGSAVLAILVKDWLRNFEKTVGGSPQRRARIRQYRFINLHIEWQVPRWKNIIPAMLMAALYLFVTGLMTLMWTLDIVSASILACVIGVLILLHAWSFLVSLFNPRSPWVSSFTELVQVYLIRYRRDPWDISFVQWTTIHALPTSFKHLSFVLPLRIDDMVTERDRAKLDCLVLAGVDAIDVDDDFLRMIVRKHFRKQPASLRRDALYEVVSYRAKGYMAQGVPQWARMSSEERGLLTLTEMIEDMVEDMVRELREGSLGDQIESSKKEFESEYHERIREHPLAFWFRALGRLSLALSPHDGDVKKINNLKQRAYEIAFEYLRFQNAGESCRNKEVECKMIERAAFGVMSSGTLIVPGLQGPITLEWCGVVKNMIKWCNQAFISEQDLMFFRRSFKVVLGSCWNLPVVFYEDLIKDLVKLFEHWERNLLFLCIHRRSHQPSPSTCLICKPFDPTLFQQLLDFASSHPELVSPKFVIRMCWHFVQGSEGGTSKHEVLRKTEKYLFDVHQRSESGWETIPFKDISLAANTLAAVSLPLFTQKISKYNSILGAGEFSHIG